VIDEIGQWQRETDLIKAIGSYTLMASKLLALEVLGPD